MAALSLLIVCLLSFLLIPQTNALQVTPNSPCASSCIDKEGTDLSDPNTSSTKPADITCSDRQYSSAAGQKWQKCMTCLQNSTFSQGSESDQLWFLYNLRYSVNYCVFNYFNQSGVSTNGVCATSRACGAIEKALEYDGMVVAGGVAEFGYCDADGGSMTGTLFGQCLSCVKTGGETMFLANAIVALETGCLQKPARGSVLGLNGTVFSKTIIGPVDPATLTQIPQAGGSSGPPTAVIAGAVAGVVLVLIIAAAIAFICLRKRRNRVARSSPVTGSNGGIFTHGHRPTSSLSFRCQTHLDPLSPRFQPKEPSISEAAWDPEAHRTHITSTKRTSSQPWGPDSVRNAPDNASIATSQKSNFTGTIAPLYLTTQGIPKAPPTAHHSPMRKSPKTPESAFTTPSSAAPLLTQGSHMPYVPQQYGIAMPLTGTEAPSNPYTTGAASANPSSPVSSKRLQDIWADAMAVSASPASTKAHNDLWADALAAQRPNRNAGQGGLYRAPSNNSASTGRLEPTSAVSLLRNNDRWAEALAAQQAASYSATKKESDVYSAGVYRPGEVPVPKSPGRGRKRESQNHASPVESRTIRVEFPPPPPRR